MGFRVNSAGQVNQGHFSRVPNQINAPRSAFDRSFSHKTTLNAGYLYPILWEPILPNDTVNLTMNVLARLATPIFPYMDNVYLDLHFFFVPNRLVWSKWEQFQGAQDDPPDTFTEYEVPSLDDATHAAGFASGSIYDYFGLPIGVASVAQANMPIALPLRSYRKIWNDWYRDENLQDPLTLDTGDGPDTTAYALLRRNRRKDYFTSCLPWPQKGDPISISVIDGPVYVKGFGKLNNSFGGSQAVLESDGTNPTYTSARLVGKDGGAEDFYVEQRGTTGFPNVHIDADDFTSITINQLRESIVLQQMLELDARGGTRYNELVLARFGAVIPDFRMQRAEYLGGQTFDVNVNPISQTSATGATGTPQGNLAGFAVARGRASINHSFVEHGQLLCLLSIRADTTYQAGLSRHWSVRSRYDYYEPLAANLGEQAVLNKEIFQNGTADDQLVFGYQERWGEYRYKPSYVTGLFRSDAAGSLDAWHLAIDFADTPALEDVIVEDPPIDRVIAVTSEDQFIVDTFTKFRHVRVMPVYSAPGLTRL